MMKGKQLYIMGVDYLKFLQNVDKNKLKRILKVANDKGFTIDGFNKNIEIAPPTMINSALKSKKRGSTALLNQICIEYGTVTYVEKLKKGSLTIEDIENKINEKNKVGLISAILVANPSEAEKAMSLLDSENLIKNNSTDIEKIEDILEENGSIIEDTASYLCEIEHPSENYYFIKPIFIVKKNRLLKITNCDEFGSTGKIKISSPKELKEYNIYQYKYYVVTIDKNDINKPKDEETGEVKAQIYEDKILNNIEPDKKILNLDDLRIYEIISINQNINDFKEKDNRIIHVNYEPMSKNIYIENKEYIYGPFRWIYDEGIINLSVNNREHLINKYSKNILKNSIYEIEGQFNFDDKRQIIYSSELNNENFEVDFIDNISLQNTILKQLQFTRTEKSNIRNLLSDIKLVNLSQERKERALRIFKRLELSDEVIDDIIKNILEDSNKHSLIVDKILENENYKKQINELSNNINEQLEIKKSELEKLNNELENIKNNINEVKAEQLENQKNEKSNEIEELSNIIEIKRKEKDEYQKKIDELKKDIMLGNSVKEWEERIKQAKDRFKFYTNEQASLEKEVNELAEKAKNEIVKISFNGLIANKMFKAANEFEKENNKDKNIITTSKEDKIDELKFDSKDELIEYIFDYVVKKANRKYSKNDIINILLCISQGFITVFAGPPGTGKTSLCDILASALGLARNDEHNRFIDVSVEKGWTSKRDFIGYYNPLTKAFDKADKRLFNAFETLNEENSKHIKDYPYLILLDEANLSPMEHYWADFMNVCDFDKSERNINLSEDFNFKIPNTLRFLATINYDHTTEILSPRLIDRSWIILLKSTELEIDDIQDYEIEKNKKIIPFSYFLEVFGAERKLNAEDELSPEISSKLKDILNLFKTENISISPRILKMIKRYCIVGKELLDESENVYVSLDYAVAQKILPLINGYGKYKEFLEELQGICTKSVMPKCNDIIKDIISNGDNKNMQYYQFFYR